MTTTRRTPTKPITDLVDHYELLLLFRKYVDQLIEDFSIAHKHRPLSFDEWYEREYKPNIESLTTVVTLQLSWYLGGSHRDEIKCRIPSDFVSSDRGGIFDIDGMRRVAKQLALKENHPETFVNYQGDKNLYRWSAD